MTPEKFNISFIKYDPHLGGKLGRGASMFIGALQFFLHTQNLGVNQKGHKWVYNTSQQWAKYLGYSSRQIERIVADLKDQGIVLVEKLSRFKGNRTNYYTVDEEKLAILLQELEETDKIEENKSPDAALESSLETSGFLDKKSECCRHKGGFFTKNTYKDRYNIKSEEGRALSVPENSQLAISSLVSNQVKQVSNEKLLGEKAITAVKSSSGKTTVAQDMLGIWNKTFEKSQTMMSKQLAPLLIAAYKNKFESDLGKWTHYCRSIASSPYLTGERFILSLMWALKYSTIERINNCELGVKELPFTSSYTHERALEHLESVDEPLKCKDIRLKLLKAYGPLNYKAWFQDLEFSLVEGKVCFKPQNKFKEDYIRNHFSQILG